MTCDFIVCINCSSDDIETYEDSETGETFHMCNFCDFHWDKGHKQWFE